MTVSPSSHGGPHPGTDPRRAGDLLAFLERLVPALAPDWSPGPGDFGTAVLEIAARLAEETTQRLDRTAERDAIAFLDLLDLPPTPPQAATGMVVITLAPEQLRAVFASARTQLSAASPDGSQVTFETQQALRVAPGRVAEVVAVDPNTDRIELAPAAVTSLEAPAPVPDRYEIVTFADTGSVLLQVSPAVGLAPGDVLRIGPSAYRVYEVDDDLVTLRDALEAPVAAGEVATRVSTLPSFDIRDLQYHAFHVGHVDLLNLEQQAIISLDLASARLARDLAGLDIAYSTYGTEEGAEEAAWLPLELLGSDGSAVRLAKTWLGTVDEVEVEGETNRWVRAELLSPVIGAAGPIDRVSQVCLDVASLEEEDGEGTQQTVPDGASTSAATGVAEGSRTIRSAFHNGTPLSTTSRFYPFGPEPLRFDSFSFAAPEALSKRGASATITIDLADSSMAAFEAATTFDSASPPAVAYGVGRNGYLQYALFPGQDTPARWFELEPVLASGERILLGTQGSLAAISLSDSSDHDLVVVPARDGGLVAAKIVRFAEGATAPTVSTDGWVALPGVGGATPTGADQAGSSAGGAAGPVAVGGLMQPNEIVVFDVLDGVLHELRVGEDLGAADWEPVAAGGSDRPVLTDGWLLTPVLGPGWPVRRAGDGPRVVIVDSEGHVWLGAVGVEAELDTLTITWLLLNPEGSEGDGTPLAALDVTPTAAWFRRPDDEIHEHDAVAIWVAYARTPGNAGEAERRLLHGVVIETEIEHVALDDDSDAEVARHSSLHANPRALGLYGRQPVTVGVGPGHGEVVAWLGVDELARTSTPEAVATGRPLLLEIDAGFEIVVPATGERLLRLPLVRPELVDYELHDRVSIESDELPHWVEIADNLDDRATSTVLVLEHKRLMDEPDPTTGRRLRIFQLDDPALAPAKELRFVRRIGRDRPRQIGTVDADDRTKITLESGEEFARERERLWIEDATYLVEELEDEVATLDRAVVGEATTVDYLAVEEVGRRDVEAADFATLAALDIEEGEPVPDRLRFVDGADPTIQQLGLTARNGVALWTQLAQPWITQPPAVGQAVLVDAFVPPVWIVDVFQRGYQNPELSWEYHDGNGWRRLQERFVDGTNDLSTSGDVTFVVPPDLAVTEIGGKDDYWIRARLVGGDYGRPSYVVETVELQPPDITRQTVVVDTTGLRPPEILSIEASFELVEPAPPEVVLVANNLAVDNQTQAASAPGAQFALFLGAAALDPDVPERAIYVGLTAPPGQGQVALLVDADDQPGGGPIQADLLTPEGWRRLTAADRTASLRRRGKISLSLDVEPVVVRLFGRDRVWLRLRAEEGGDSDWAPVVNGLRLNPVELTQARTIEDEILGSSLGEPGLPLELSERPVLPDTIVLRVRERLGAEEQAALEVEHRAAAAAGSVPVDGPDDEPEPLVRSGLERLPGTWVLWRRVDSLVGQGPEARVYHLDPATGTVTFGDGRSGKVPPAGSDGIRAFRYQQGGGEVGNLPAWSDAKLISSVEGAETAALPIETAGGFSGGDADDLFLTGPDRLRHAGQAMAPADIESIAVAASPGVVQARCVRPDGPGRPVVVAIAARGDGRCPQPSLAERDAVADLVRARGWGGLDADAVEVVGPEYRPATVTARLLAPVDQLAEVERRAEETLADILHPIDGGPDGRGWPFGRPPTVSDLLRALADVGGLDRVDSIEIVATGPGSLDRMPANGLVCVEATDITVIVESTEAPA